MSTEPEYILENNFIAQLTGLGYQLTYVNNVGLLKDNLRLELERLNDCKLSDSEWYKVQTQLTKGSKSIDRARLLREQLIIERDGQPALRLKLADQRNWQNNSFQVLNQFQKENGNIKNRYDVTILMNGLPVVHDHSDSAVPNLNPITAKPSKNPSRLFGPPRVFLSMR